MASADHVLTPCHTSLVVAPRQAEGKGVFERLTMMNHAGQQSRVDAFADRGAAGYDEIVRPTTARFQPFAILFGVVSGPDGMIGSDGKVYRDESQEKKGKDAKTPEPGRCCVRRS